MKNATVLLGAGGVSLLAWWIFGGNNDAGKYPDMGKVLPTFTPCEKMKKPPADCEDKISAELEAAIFAALDEFGLQGSKALRDAGKTLPVYTRQDFIYLQNIINQESAGIVGIPNYLYLPMSEDEKNWPKIYESIVNNEYIGKRYTEGEYKGQGSTATGLGQHTRKNVQEHYPHGFDGIASQSNELYGCLSYGFLRYTTMEAAWKYKLKTGIW